MIDFGGTIYYIDISAFDKAVEPAGQKSTDTVTTLDVKIMKDKDGIVTGTEEYHSTRVRGKELDPARFDILKTMLDVIIDFDDESDTSLGAERVLETSSLAFKIAFNTLYNYGIIKEKQ